MPAPMLKSLAKKAGISMDKAETLWDKAKSQAAKGGRAKDWPYVTGIWKKMAGLKERTAEDVISAVSEGVDVSRVVGVISDDVDVRTYYDAGMLRIATLDDILVEPGIDTRADTVLHLANELDWPVEHPMTDFEFEGSLNDLYNKVMNLVNHESYNRRKGARKAARTKLRR